MDNDMDVSNYKVWDLYCIQIPYSFVGSKKSKPKCEFTSKFNWIEQNIHVSIGKAGPFHCVHLKHKIGNFQYEIVAGQEWYETARTLGPTFSSNESNFCEQLLITAISNFPELLFLILNSYRDLGYQSGKSDNQMQVKIALGLR